MPDDNSVYLLKPGLHSYNSNRHNVTYAVPKSSGVSNLRILLLLIGIACLGYYSYTVADQKIYQVYENWAFDQQIAGRPSVTFRDYVRERTPFGFLAGIGEGGNESTKPSEPTANQTNAPVPVEGSVIGRVAIDRLNLSAVVRQGVGNKTLSEAVGHVPSTALPGQPGNFAIAAHRDTLFRALKDIQAGDIVTFQAQSGLYNYQVVATRIVKPTDVSVLRPDGGGLIEPAGGSTPNKLLTMITCYPFYYVGSAPKRFIVEAKLVNNLAYNSASPRP